MCIESRPTGMSDRTPMGGDPVSANLVQQPVIVPDSLQDGRTGGWRARKKYLGELGV